MCTDWNLSLEIQYHDENKKVNKFALIFVEFFYVNKKSDYKHYGVGGGFWSISNLTLFLMVGIDAFRLSIGLMNFFCSIFCGGEMERIFIVFITAYFMSKFGCVIRISLFVK